MQPNSDETSVDRAFRAEMRRAHMQLIADPSAGVPTTEDARTAFPYNIMKLCFAFERARAQCRRLYPASPQERLAIGTTWDIGPLSMTELAQAISLSIPATSALVDRLVTRGFLARVPDPKDRRRINVSVTAVAMASMDGPVFEGMARMAEQLTEFDGETLDEVNRVLHSTWGVLDEFGQHLSAMSDEELHDSAAAWDAQHGALLVDED